PRWLAGLLPGQRRPATATSRRTDAYGAGGRDPYGGSPADGSSSGRSSYDDEFDEAT
ncbi:hypothetical protein G3I30_03775, partial [Actinospica acidiphila]|nr:hypothetical protein [Actinospica acidiphila]